MTPEESAEVVEVVESSDTDTGTGTGTSTLIESPSAGPEGDAEASDPSLDSVIRDLRRTDVEIEQSLEALLVSTRVPLTVDEIGLALHLERPKVEGALERLDRSLERRALGLFHKEKDGQRTWILDVKAAYRADAASVAPPLLKPAVTETLALIAINQPIPQSRLVRERGSTVYDHVKELVQRGLVQKVPQGRSYSLRTTDGFAAEFGLANDPDMIRRALARAAAAEGAPEVIGSTRIHFEDDEEGLTRRTLFAEAQRVHSELPPGPPASAAFQPPEPPGSPEEAGAVSEAGRLGESGGAQAVSLAPALAPAPVNGDVSPGDDTGDLPVVSEAPEIMAVAQEDCVVSGGEAPPDERRVAESLPSPNLEEDSMNPAASPEQDDVTPEASPKTSDPSRVESLMALTEDTDTTDDDW